MKAVRAAVAVVTGAALTAGGVAAWDAPILQLRKVEVGGNRRVEARDVVVASGLTDRDHLLKISTSGVASHVEASPWVSEAKVERILPSKVRITVVERTAAAIVTTPGGSYLADRAGVVLEQVPPGVTAPGGAAVLPLVADLPVTALLPGERIGPAQYRQSLAILSSLPAAVREQVRVVHGPSPENLTFELADGTVVLYGAAEGMGDKAFAIKALTEKASAEHMAIASIDVRVPTRPALRPR